MSFLAGGSDTYGLKGGSDPDSVQGDPEHLFMGFRPL